MSGYRPESIRHDVVREIILMIEDEGFNAEELAWILADLHRYQWDRRTDAGAHDAKGEPRT